MKTQIIGNWKMNGSTESLESFGKELKTLLQVSDDKEIGVAVPFPYLSMARHCVFNDTIVKTGAQNCALTDEGAFTGEVSTKMIRDVEASFVIVGHSERRTLFGEGDTCVKNKTSKTLEQSLTPIICIGESAEEREAGKHLDVIKEQLKGSVPIDVDQSKIMIAYEPVWAIGTGKVASLEDIKQMHDFIVKELGFNQCPLLYGGSVKPGNAKDILSIETVHGALIGGASLKAEDFAAIYNV